ncbi:MAG: orotate phosphoribosyltransferase [Bifidobacterium adolescentis]|jgi:orotate phosphoribosyltransferase
MTDSLEAVLQERGAILRGHFQYASGRHGDVYVEKFRILQWPDVTERMCKLIAEHFRGTPNLVVGPTTGGAILSYETARQLGLASLIAERKEEGSDVREFKRGFQIGPGDKVLIVDDVMTTGGSIRHVIDAVHARGAEVVGVAALVDRTAGQTDFGVPFFACISVDIKSYDPAECEQCKRGVELKIT